MPPATKKTHPARSSSGLTLMRSFLRISIPPKKSPAQKKSKHGHSFVVLKSMTGFGRSELKVSHGLIRAEVKSVNHKFLEVSLRLPGHLNEFEEAVRHQVAQKIRRGKITLSVQAPDPSVVTARLVLNESLAKEVA